MKKSGFTLAEVLITLGIIGVVSAVTLPTLMSNSQYKQVGVKLSKFHSTLENAAMAYVAAGNSFDGSIPVLDKSGDDAGERSVTIPENRDKADEAAQAAIGNFIDETFILKTVYEKKDTVATDNTLKIKGGAYSRPKTQAYPKGVLKDGTTIQPWFAYEGTSSAVDTVKYPSDKYGSGVFVINFAPEVKGLPENTQRTYNFVVTDKGLVLPYKNDNCFKAIYDNDWVVSSSLFKSDGVCYRKTDNWDINN